MNGISSNLLHEEQALKSQALVIYMDIKGLFSFFFWPCPKCLWTLRLKAENRLHALRVSAEVKCVYFSIETNKPIFSGFFTNWHKCLQWMQVTNTTQCEQSMRNLRLLFLWPLLMTAIAGLDSATVVLYAKSKTFLYFCATPSSKTTIQSKWDWKKL